MEALNKPIDQDIVDLLLQKADEYNQPSFISTDPISIPHLFSKKQDIEIAGFLAATIAWGNRKMIINNATKLVQIMDHAPHDFILNHTENDLGAFNGFVHRTFNAVDIVFFVKSLQNYYKENQSLEDVFKPMTGELNMKNSIYRFREMFLSTPHLQRSDKHIANPLKGSASKRIVMYLRWMVRQDKAGVDFGLWKSISPSLLSCPLDVHSGNVARKLGLLQRKQNDWKAVEELDESLRSIDVEDPARLDYALFGLGVFEGF